eukprot:3285920-Karenia_brevis.AAC.1
MHLIPFDSLANDCSMVEIVEQAEFRSETNSVILVITARDSSRAISNRVSKRSILAPDRAR